MRFCVQFCKSIIDLIISSYNCLKLFDYSNHGKAMAIGDFNSRTINEIDFISDDKLPVTVRNNLIDFMSYGSDCELSERINPDCGHNDFGNRLLQLCKAGFPLTRFLPARVPARF